ncbi:MAG: hypothetical protein NTW87_03955 [Planctomycetota bacterium]|nr:hypothetical protein [Planctomycetota bacterium]
MTFNDKDPRLPFRWMWNANGPVDMRLAPEAHSGTQALKVVCPKGNLDLRMAVIEVVPGATYSFGGWAKGKGNGKVTVFGTAYEGPRELAKVDFAFNPEWTESRKTVSIPGNIRTVTISVSLWSSADALVDDVFFSADLAEPLDVNAVLTTKYKKDDHTLLYVDFDGQNDEYRLQSAELTNDKGGRFGKGVRIEQSKVSSVAIPVTLKEMPPEGTLEFWLAPDDDPPEIYHFMYLLAGDLDIMQLHADTSSLFRLFWRTADGGGTDSYHDVKCQPEISRAWFRPGQWHHIAYTWDREAVRFYVDGGLANYLTDRPLPFFKLPTTIFLGSGPSCRAWSGAFDEIRLSDIRRYGPAIPVGAKWSPFVAASENAAPDSKKPAPPPEKAAPDFAKERKALIGTIPPPPNGAISFDAAQVKPLVHDDPDFKVLENTPIPGMTVARIGTPQAEMLRVPDNDGGYWKLSGVPNASYHVGIWYESSRDGLESPQHYRGLFFAFLNGRALQLSTHSDPIQVAPGVHYVEAQSKAAEPLKDGDEIEVLGATNQPVRVARLTLYSKEPARGRGLMFENYGASWFTRDSALRLNAFCGFRVKQGKALRGYFGDLETDSPDCLQTNAEGKALAHYKISNPLPMPLTVKCRAEVKAYFRELAGSEDATIELKPHERATREVPFTIVPDSRRYSMEVKVSAVHPPSLGWPQADTIEFFKGVRQSVPWPDTFSNYFWRAVSFGQPLPGVRQSISLNGRWESAFTALPTALPFPAPADLTWQPRQVPFEINGGDQKPPAHGLYVRRKFTLPQGDGARTWRLLIKEVLDEATVYVNGTKVGNVRGVRTPILCDITAALHPGENEILIAVRDALANMDPAYVNPNKPETSPQFLDAPGCGYGCAFKVSNVELKSSPLVTAEDLQVNTSVRNRAVTANFNVVNRRTSAARIKVTASVLDAGRPVMDIGETTADLAAGASKAVNLGKPWGHPVYWGPGSPQLYTMAIRVTDATTGEQLDLLRERFGFRDCWIQDGRVMLNGVPVRLKGSNCQGGGGVGGGDDVQWSRGSDGLEDYMDEFGCLTGYYTLGGLGNTPSRHNVESNSYWDIETRNVLAGAKQYVNHPCLITWDLSNEWLSYLDYGGGDPLAGARRFKAVGEALAAYDPSRWILFDGDGDLHGLWNTLSEHYSNPYYGDFAMRGHSPYLPDSRFWRELDKDFKAGEGVVGSAFRPNVLFYPDKTVLMDTENAWKVDGLQPPGLSLVVGDDDVLSPAIDSGRGAIVWYWKQNVDGHRDLGFSIVCNYTPITGLAHRGHMLQCFIMPEHSHHYFSGGKFQRRYSLHNDLLVPSKYEFRWALLGKGKAVAKGNDKRKMNSGDMQRGQISFDLPKVDERTLYTLKLDLLADGNFAYGEERDIEVFPDNVPRFAAPARTLFLFDPHGTTAEVFKKAGLPFTPVDKLAAPEGRASETVLVIGEHALRSDAESSAGALSAFAEAGGRVVTLMQDRLLSGLPIRTTLEKREWCSMLFLRTPQHPIVKGLDSWDLQFWAPDHILAKGSYSKPDSGSFVTLVDGAGDHDRSARSAMEWNQILECYRGQGSYLLCQLPLIEKFNTEPMARELLSRLVAYEGSGTLFHSPAKTLKVVSDPGSRTVTRLRDLGILFQTVQTAAAMDENTVLLLDAATLPSDFAVPPTWKTALGNGATIIIHSASPEQKPLLANLAGGPVEMTVHPYAMWEGRGLRNGFTWLTPGLSHIDLYWKDYAGDEGAVAQAEQPKYKIEDLNRWSVSAKSAVEHVFPGALVEIPVGKGRLIVDKIRWETASKKLAVLTSRVVSAMMTGLDVAIAPYVPPRNLPQDAIYKPIDLSAFCNRGFIDDVGEDGKGGWPDQGPKADLREFPTGDQNFGGVPFKVGKEPRCCIVLKSASRPFQDLYPDEATIPVGIPVEGLCFLHSTSWGAQGPTGVYQIQYADGTTAEIALVENENIFGWTRAPAEFPQERGTRSRVAWTGTTGLFPLICVCQMLWVNPKPDVPVRAVRFANPQKNMCPVLIALAAAVRPGKADFEALAAAQAKAKEFLQKGIAAFDAGRDAEARETLEQAVREDPKLDAAHQRLCELAERGKDDNAILAAYKAWAAAGPRSFLPYNKIGAILEKRGDDKGALEAYTKSIEVEWNQPPIIEAKSRLTLKLKQ